MQLSFDFSYHQPENPEQQQRFQNWLLEMLKMHELEVTFKKASGEVRVMTATLIPEKLPRVEQYSQSDKKPRTPSRTSCSVFDTEAQDWRSFRWDSIIKIRLT